MSEVLLLAGDCGGSKTELMLVNGALEDQGSLMMGTVSPSYTGGLEQTARLLEDAVKKLLVDSGYQSDERIKAAVIGMAGIDTTEQETAMSTMLSATVADKAEVFNDIMLPLGKGWGIALVAGAGSNCTGRNEQGQVARAGGHGRRFDEGSALWVASRALEVVSKLEDGRIAAPTDKADDFIRGVYDRAATSLHEMRLSKKLNDGKPTEEPATVQQFSDLYGALYRHGSDVELRLLHDIAPRVIDLAQGGVSYAEQVVRLGARELALHVGAVAGKLALQEVSLVVTGSMLSRSPYYRQLLSEELARNKTMLKGSMRVMVSPVRAAINMAHDLVQPAE